ncbi:hypothetical protein PG993_014100 [Apiospora rasikravindrae]|uniref:Uncharacterized protein n=1 Tax=Apiospora rasikravindrae TaxID=990691 RepID=A0ABR1RS12_9PEZI
MKLFAALVLFSPTLVTAAPTSNTVTISNFIYRAPAGGLSVDGQHVDRYMRFQLSIDDTTCQALDVDIPATGYVCDDPAYTFDTLDPGVLDATFLIRLYRSIGDDDGSKLSGDFRIIATGPLFTIKDQVGTTTGTLTPSQ